MDQENWMKPNQLLWLVVSASQLNFWGSADVGWESSGCSHFPTLVDSLLYTHKRSVTRHHGSCTLTAGTSINGVCHVMEIHHHHHHHHHLTLSRDGRWGTTDDFATSLLHFSLFSTALWDLPNSRPVHFLILSSHLFLCLPSLLLPFIVPYKMVLADLMNGRHDHTTAVCVSLRSSGGLRVVQMPAGSLHGLPRW